MQQAASLVYNNSRQESHAWFPVSRRDATNSQTPSQTTGGALAAARRDDKSQQSGRRSSQKFKAGRR